MWIITILFVAVLVFAHLAAGLPQALDLHISEMRSETPFAHVLFLLLIAGALCFAHRARRKRHEVSAVLGVILALLILAAWVTPTYSDTHEYVASVPFILLFLYVPVMLMHGEHFLAGAIVFTFTPILDLLLVFAGGGSSGQLQKFNALLFFVLLNYLYYIVLPEACPLLHSRYEYPDETKPKSRRPNQVHRGRK